MKAELISSEIPRTALRIRKEERPLKMRQLLLNHIESNCIFGFNILPFVWLPLITYLEYENKWD
ncbi:hypothetical protein IC582_001422 [Cucumis melo]